jgi:hypothetical protein
MTKGMKPCLKCTDIVQFVTNNDILSKIFTILCINLPIKNILFGNQTFSTLARYVRIRRGRQDIIASKFPDWRCRLQRSHRSLSTPLEAYYMIKKALLALAISGTMLSAQAGVVLTEGFDDISTLTTSGWVLTNASTPVGSTSLFQGNSDAFTSQAGAANSYIAANFNSTTPGGAVNDWLITPTFSALYGATVTFWLRGAADAGYLDQISFGFSNGSAALTSFVLGSLVTATDTWTQVTATLAAGSGSARFAINYAGPESLADYIGIDSLTITANEATGDVPEPASLAILAAGLIGMGAARRRKNAAAV